MNKKHSRGTSIDVEQCVRNVGDRFNLVLIAAARAREIAKNHKTAENTTQVNAPVTALLDIQEGRIGRDYLERV
jgi:DNA-directed RNA polymerase subunit omega